MRALFKGSHQDRIHSTYWNRCQNLSLLINQRNRLEIVFHTCVENTNILDQFLNNEEAKYFNTQVYGADRYPVVKENLSIPCLIIQAIRYCW
jgi:hypothetical protein